MRRREYLTVAVVIGTPAFAGCLGGDDNGDDDDDEEIAAEGATAINEALGLVQTDDGGWHVDDGEWHVDFWASGALRDDIVILAEAYAEMVSDGFDPDASATGWDEDTEEVLYEFPIERQWATDWLDGELSDGVYFDLIEIRTDPDYTPPADPE